MEKTTDVGATFTSYVDGLEPSLVVSDAVFFEGVNSSLEQCDDLLLANPDWVDVDRFNGRRCIAVDPTEPDGANVVRIGGSILAAAAFPRTADRLTEAGLDVHLIDASELARAEGALTCCSLLFDERSP